MKTLYSVIFSLLFLLPIQHSAQIYINEWMSSNSSIIADPDFDETGDWIELFNDFNDTLDLSGHYLSDNLGEPTKWQFPNNTKVAPNEFLLIWADGENIGLHTNFKLAKDGEEIGLFNPDTLTLDSIIYSFQETDISMGRQTDGSLDLGFFLTPTPGASNTTEAFDGMTFYQPHFSVKGGFYDSPIEVTLSTIGGTIRYTLDGSLPTVNSTEYTLPLQISETTNLRASVFQPNFIPSKPVTHTYFFDENFEERGLPVISISTNPEYFWDPEIGLYVQDFKPEWEYPINIEFFENDGGNRAVFNELAGTKVNGLNSWELPQKMLGIYFDNEYDENNLEYPLFFDGERSQYDNFTLRASGSDWSNTLFRDALCQGLTAENMDLEKMAYRPAIAFVNGEYLGIHNLRSRIDESFIEDNFGYGNNTYDLIENDGEVEEGDAVAFNELFALFEEDLTNEINFQAVENLMDIENFTDFFITEIWTGNSSYGHNIQLWKPKTTGTKWRWILQDFDRGFTGSDNNDLDYFTIDNNPNDYEWIRTPFRNMLENEGFAQQFAARFTDHLYTTFHPERVTNSIIEYKTRIEKEIPFHVEKWAGTMSNYGDGIPSVEFWEDEVEDLITFSQERQGFMIDDLQDYFNLEDAVNLGTMCLPQVAGTIEINGIKIPDSPWNGPYFKNMPFELEAKAGVGYEFQGWSIASLETLIEKESEWKYLDDGSDQNTAWQAVDFDDNNWNNGLAELGYGDGNENTEVSFGNNSNDKYITTYFRKSFTITNIQDYDNQLIINLRRDDGAVVYVNGEEVIRSNMPTDEITFETFASQTVANAGETTFNTFQVKIDQLLEGENVIAVEIHQANNTSSDISFDLELKALKIDQTNIFSTEALLPINLSADSIFVANFELTSDCLLPREITENTTLTIDCSPYFAPDDVTVFDSITLVVEPGVEIHFPENASLFIKGNLQVEGTEAAPVLFKNIEGIEKWGMLNFQFSTDTSRLNWLEIRNASKGFHPIHDNAALTAFHSIVEINHLKIDDVFGNPIFTEYSNISLKNSQLHSKITGDLINVKYGWGFIENCDFRGNNQPDTDAVDYDEVTNGVIRNSKIYDFFGFNSDGIDLGEESSEVLIENNFIHNVTDKAISVGQLSSIFAQNNTIINCTQGLGIKDLSVAEIDQNTFHNTQIPIACFEKNVGVGGGMAFVSNSILSNSPEAPFFADEYSNINISNSLSDTESIPGIDNIWNHPRFENPTQNNFQLQNNSPAIAAGFDDLGNVIDLGAKFHEFSAAPNIQISAINYHPEFDAEAEFLQIYNPGFEVVDLTDYTFSMAFDFVFPNVQIAPNETIWLAKDATLFPDVTEQIFTWTSGKLSNGGETIRLSDSYGIIIDQVIYDDELPWGIEADGQGGWLSLISPDLDNHFAESWQIEGITNDETQFISELNIQVFPNPTADFVNIYSEKTPIERVEIFNLLGQKMEEINLEHSNEMSLNLEGLSQGIWFLKINGNVISEKLVVVKG